MIRLTDNDILVVDIDECIFDTHKQFYQCLVDRFGNEPRFKELRNVWAMEEVLDEEELSVIWGNETGYSSEVFQAAIQPKTDALEVLNGIASKTIAQLILSDAPKEIQEIRKDYFNSNLPNYIVMFTHHDSSMSKTEAFTKEQVVEAMNDLGVYIIEDSPHHIKAMLEIKGVKNVIVFNMPYNQDIKHDKIIRVDTWKEVESLFD